jgi:hypothetical protein
MRALAHARSSALAQVLIAALAKARRRRLVWAPHGPA